MTLLIKIAAISALYLLYISTHTLVKKDDTALYVTRIAILVAYAIGVCTIAFA